jgi:hypothetical protein
MPWRFDVHTPAKYRNAETGLYYLRARYYDPVSRQLISRDPLLPTTRARPILFEDWAWQVSVEPGAFAELLGRAR